CIPGVDGEIDQSQFELVRINLDCSDLLRNLRTDLDVRTNGMPQEIQHFGDQFLQSDKFDCQFLPSRKGEQPRGEGSTALGALDGPVQQAGNPRLLRHRLLQQAQASQYDR